MKCVELDPVKMLAPLLLLVLAGCVDTPEESQLSGKCPAFGSMLLARTLGNQAAADAIKRVEDRFTLDPCATAESILRQHQTAGQ